MKSCQQLPLLLWLAAVVAINILGSNVAGENLVKKLTKPLQVIPYNDNSSNVTKLVIKESLITLNEADRLALSSYPRLVELHLDGNLVTSIPANYFSVMPQLKVLSLSRNKISSLDPESFSGLDFLTEVDLSHNLLTSLHTQLFRRLNKLQVWNLQENPWNCSCPLLNDTGDVEAAGVGGPKTECASLESQDGRDLLQAVCDPSPTPTFATDPQKPPTAVNFQQVTMLKTTMTSQNLINKDQTPVLGNTWKFTVCVVALALCTAMLIICGIKGPSWYKLFYNYRHRRLHQEDAEEEEEDAVSTVFTETRRHRSHQTFTFEQENGRTEQEEEEEEEDGYFEDPYIKREE
uniref:leucine-rich repeat-containing protein 19-like isoform X2 n=1 Tax=Scatophagus argus TaxID=75038 RepID=UPI001ED816B4|nr:leucine-rich repeat-containing protein 19-like isoform X2 [Scatophagus argus]